MERAAISARGIQVVGNQEWMNLYLAINGIRPQAEVRRALCNWRNVPKTFYPGYFKSGCNSNFFQFFPNYVDHPPQRNKHIHVGLTQEALDKVTAVMSKIGLQLNPGWYKVHTETFRKEKDNARYVNKFC